MKSLLPLLIFPFLLICLGKQSETKENQKVSSLPLVENHSNLTNVNLFEDFIRILKNKECQNLKKLLGQEFHYNVSEASHVFFFYKKDRYLDFLYNIDVCDFFFNQRAFEYAMFKETGLKQRITPRDLVVNSREILIFVELENQPNKYRVRFQIEPFVKNDLPVSYLPTTFFFNCSANPPSKCVFESVSSWILSENN